jgi:hypothetical protein
MFRQKFLTLILTVGILSSQFVSTVAAAGTCDWAKFISDVTVADNASFPPGVPFTKTWRLQNIGTCTWSTSYSLVHHSGERMSTVSSVSLNRPVAPGEMVDISVNMISPLTGGQHDGAWILSNASGVRFGISSNAAMPIWVDILWWKAAGWPSILLPTHRTRNGRAEAVLCLSQARAAIAAAMP